VVGVKVADQRVSKEVLDHHCHPGAFGQIGFDHHAINIIAPERVQPRARTRGKFIDPVMALGRTLPHQDRSRGAISGIGWLMQMVQEQRGVRRQGF
jgi:hypothetical protein